MATPYLGNSSTKKDRKLKKFFRLRWPAYLIVLAVVATITVLSMVSSKAKTEVLSELTTQAKQGQVASVIVNSSTHNAFATLKDGRTFDVAFPASYEGQLIDHLVSDGVKVDSTTKLSFLQNLGRNFGLILSFVFFTIAFGAILLYAQGGSKGLSRLSRRKHEEPAKVPSQRFADVHGADEAVDVLTQVCEFLKDPEAFTRDGESISRGYILSGEPGNGKTLLACALAGEAGVPFFRAAGGDFIEMFAGQTTHRVRRFFDALPKGDAPAVVFIDEVDAIGEDRTDNIGSNRDKNATVTQFLTEISEMLDNNRYLVIIAATNRFDRLDPALKRPEGRLGYHITMGKPTTAGRKAILQANVAGFGRMAEDIDFDHLARLLAERSGAEVASIPKRAATISRRAGSEQITQRHLEDAIHEVIVGISRPSIKVTPEDEKITAIHESGHLFIALLTESLWPYRATIVPIGEGIGGATFVVPSERMLMDKSMINDRLVQLMGGRAAEERVLGMNVSVGAAHDLAEATKIALIAVCQAGFGLGRSVDPERWTYDPSAAVIAAEVESLINKARTDARNKFGQHPELFEALRSQLLEHKTLDAAAINALAVQHGLTPRLLPR